MKSFPWDAIVEGFDDKTGFPIYDRQYDAKDFRDVMSRFFSNGIFSDEPLGFAVSAGTGMSVTVEGGTCFINGTTGVETDTRTLMIPEADTTYPRIDTIVLRWDADLDRRSIDLYVLTGKPAQNPVRPSLTRVKDDVWELGICDILTPAGSVSVAGTRITDTRLETSRCGIVAPFAEFDTTSFYTFLTNKVNSLADEVERDSLQYLEDTKSEIEKKYNDTYSEIENKINEGAANLANMRNELQKQTDTAVELAKSALDGTTAGHLQNEIDAINDYTTGINLLRGTRDFVLGREVYDDISFTVNSGYKDGFYIAEGNIIKDFDGFYYVRNNGGTTALKVISNVMTHKTVPQNLTVSFEVRLNDIMIADISNMLRSIFAIYRKSNKTRIIYYGLSSAERNKVSVPNKWYKLKYEVTIPEEYYNDDYYYRLDLYTLGGIPENGIIDFKKPKIEHGHINNPIWSPSPFDIDYINDGTAGINLLRGTRDFARGKNVPGQGSQSHYGWPSPNNTTNFLSIDDDEFTVLKLTKDSGTSATAFYQIIDENFEKGEYITISFDVKIPDLDSFTSTVIGQIGIASKATSGYIASSTIPKSLYGIQENEWTHIVYSYEIPQTVTDETYLLIGLAMNNTGTVEFKRPKLERGIAYYPKWSASPFDVAQQSDYEALLKRVEALESK